MSNPQLEHVPFDKLTLPNEVMTGVDASGSYFIFQFKFDDAREPILVLMPINAAKQLVTDIILTITEAIELGIINDERGITEEAS